MATYTTMEGPHHIAIRELDLRTCHPSTMADRVGAVPVLKTSAAFFTFLRANLVLHSAMTSATNSPQLGPSVPFSSYVPPSPSPLAASGPFCGFDDDDDIEPLSLEVLDKPQDKIEGLRLVADSIAQMRQRASLNLVFHPLCLAGLSTALAAIYHLGGVSRLDPGLGMTISCGVIMSYLMGIRYLASGYISLAERLRWNWLRADDGEEDTLLAARLNDDIIGTLVLRLEPNPTSGHRRRRSLSLRGGKGVIRAWTTNLHYRGKGVGKDLLHEAVRVTKERCGKDAEIGFAQEHANSAMLLPSIFNAPFRRDEVRATKALDGVLADWDMFKRRR
ncbi:hypothetical protein LCI18_008046 [Fusarium solani-melongenae]|uniref:Uncharacterized protein n=1 Tax=Fusarium solani subsp. cucurbitae TaxID=2747967 RepID=A0ACD3Z7H8_FUSSC|nr:hypothetical protein LCI18_008046 [Fusarium solani-melongenae]